VIVEVVVDGGDHAIVTWPSPCLVWRIGPTGDPQAALVYFSFVTLTTVGYGDITPQWPGAGGLAAAEALVGQLYLAITIARLVGMHTSKRM
jgi:hypothetical protein